MTPTPLLRDIDIRRNESPSVVRLILGIDAGDGVVTPIDLSGRTARLQLRDYEGAIGTAALGMTSDAATVGGSLVDMGAAFQGVIRLVFGSADLLALPVPPLPGTPTLFSYDLLLADGSGAEACYATGAAILHQGTTL